MRSPERRSRDRSPDRRERDTRRDRDRSPVRRRHSRSRSPHRQRDRDGAQGSVEEPLAAKAEPLSLEEMLKQRAEAAAAESKPVFISRAEREQLALAKRSEAVAAQRTKTDSTSRAHDPFEDHGRRAADRESREAASRMREEERRKASEGREKEKELAAIRAQYLGGAKLKKKVVKPSDKLRFNFDWNAGEDTSRDANPLYAAPHEAQLLFGRGLRAGMDRIEQKRAAAKHEQAALLRDAGGVGGEPTATAARERAEFLRRVVASGTGAGPGGVAGANAAADERGARDRARARGDDVVAGANAEKSADHWSFKPLERMRERDWRIFREDFNISFKGPMAGITPARNWAESGLPAPILKAVAAAGYKEPSPIQMAAIPLGLRQRDVIGISKTGSGKTAAFVLPMLAYIMRLPPMDNEIIEAEGPYAVIMAPTRELAQQIEEETVKFARYLEYRVTCVIGGGGAVTLEEQGFKLRKGCEIIIATPGRLIDCLDRRYAVLNQCNYVVLDEADRMIDMGFEPQVLAVMDTMPTLALKPEDEAAVIEDSAVYRVTYMFSATMPPAVERLARKYMRRSVTITIGTAGRATDSITQTVHFCKDSDKDRYLDTALRDLGDKQVILFCNTKKTCDYVARRLDGMGYRSVQLHGGKAQDQREVALQGFRDHRYNILVATDVAGRGIDVPDVAMVINYDMPSSIEPYTHRIGRTGRAGKTGVAVSLLTLHDTEIFFDLKNMLMACNMPVPPELLRHEASKVKGGGGTETEEGGRGKGKKAERGLMAIID